LKIITLFPGLLFLRNYLRKKNAAAKSGEGDRGPRQPGVGGGVSKIFNSIPVPFPPKDDFYGPLYIPDELVSTTI
jgi:hypothetical protein